MAGEPRYVMSTLRIKMCGMFTIQAIDDLSPHLEAVKRLWRPHSDKLGFMPAGAFAEYAQKRHIIVALSGEDCIGYLLYRVVRDRATIAHFCIAPPSRGKGVARSLLNFLVDTTKGCRAIVLTCRRDFEASETWPRLGFHAAGEKAGRAADGSELVCWVLDHGHADLFSSEGEQGGLAAAIDSNVFLDLMERREEETLGLLADWLQPFVTLCYTPELLNEFNRHKDSQVRQKRMAEAQQFTMLRCSPAAFRKAEETLKPLFPAIDNAQDESDFRQLVGALAAEADAFVTRDESLLDRAERVFDVCGLPVVRPAELIGRLDVIEHEREYQRSFIAGTRQISRQRINRTDDDLIAAVQYQGEQRRAVAKVLNRFLADPQSIRCEKIANNEGATLALFAIERDSRIDRVPFLRICAKRKAGTIARAVLSSIIREAATAGSNAIFLTDTTIPDVVQVACSDLGFLPVTGGWLKLVLRGWLPTADVADAITWPDPKVDEFRTSLQLAKTDTIVASRLEHLIWPGKLADASLPCFIVPILPQFAEHLFDERLANGSLFGADVDLALNPESAYYRAARPAGITCPARLLWYVSQRDSYPGSKAIRGCSRLIEIALGTPKQLYSRFRRLGVYEWPHVLETAKGDLNKVIMALRFDDSESLAPVRWATFQGILRAHGINNNLQSPTSIPPLVFGEIYAVALDSSSAC